MANSRMNSFNFSGKRPAFAKEFGRYGKKPRLDVKLTQFSTPPSKAVENIKDPEDELWGEELPEDVVEECVLLATQACMEDNLERNEGSTTSVMNHASTSSNGNTSYGIPAPPVSCHLPRPGSSSFGFQQKNQFEPSTHTNKSPTLLINKKNENADAFLERDKKIENENKELKQKCLQKEGEVAILRSQLQKLELQIKTQSLEHRKSLEMQSQKYSKQISDQRKELEVTNTQLQFQIMEATSIRNHCKILESGSKIKFVEPEPSKVGTPKRRKDDDEKRAMKNVASPVNQKNKNKADKVENQIIEYCAPEQNFFVKEGSVFGTLVNEYLTDKSQPDNSWILYLRKKQDQSGKIKKDGDTYQKILVLQKNNVTLQNCYDSVNYLVNLDALDSIDACVHVATIVWQCQRIICRQLNIMSLISSFQSPSELSSSNSTVASLIGKSAGLNSNFLTSQKLYEEEEGIESRRAIGLLHVLCSMSSLASELFCSSLTGNSVTSICTSRITERIKSTEGTSKEPQTDVNEVYKTILEFQKNRLLPYNDYIMKPLGFLQLLRDVIFSICYQKRTNNFTGFLTASLKLLSAIGRNIQYLDGRLELVSEIIREVVFCRPQVEAVVALFELLSVIATYPLVMKLLCVNSDEQTFVDNRALGLAYFTRESCVTQVLFKLLPANGTSVQLRTDLSYYMVNWLFTVVYMLLNEEFVFNENKNKKCHCRSSIASGLLSTLNNSLCDLNAPNLEDQVKNKLLETFRKSVVLLRLCQEFKSTLEFFNRDNFEYQFLLARIDTEADALNLNDLERKLVKELNDKPENEDDTSSGAGNEVGELYEVLRIYQKSLPNHSLYFTSNS